MKVIATFILCFDARSEGYALLLLGSHSSENYCKTGSHYSSFCCTLNKLVIFISLTTVLMKGATKGWLPGSSLPKTPETEI
jgi:hypothetical protein